MTVWNESDKALCPHKIKVLELLEERASENELSKHGIPFLYSHGSYFGGYSVFIVRRPYMGTGKWNKVGLWPESGTGKNMKKGREYNEEEEKKEKEEKKATIISNLEAFLKLVRF